MINASKHFDLWALKMTNSWGKFPPTGLFEGTVTDFGDYDECLAVNVSQYCSIRLSLPLPKLKYTHNIYYKIDGLFANQNESNMFTKLSDEASIFYWTSLQFGICLPQKCNESDAKSIAKTGKYN